MTGNICFRPDIASISELKNTTTLDTAHYGDYILCANGELAVIANLTFDLGLVGDVQMTEVTP